MSPSGIYSIILTLLLPIALFLCVLLHEYGHALAARMFGIGTRDITLYPLGGVARLERMSERPIEEIIISLAGPAVNVAIASFMLLGYYITRTPFRVEEAEAPTSLQDFAVLVTITNIVLFVFNLAPAFPMDGGRVFRAFLSFIFPRILATQIAVFVGLGFALLFGLAGLLLPNPFLLLVALFVPVAGFLELAMLRQQEAMRRYKRRMDQAGNPAVEEWDAPRQEAPPEPNFSGYTWDSRGRVWVEWRDGWPIRSCRMRGL